MVRRRFAFIALVTFLADLWPKTAEADGDHVHIGDFHADPLILGIIGAFILFIVIMFVGQWIRVNAERRKTGATLSPKESAVEEDIDELDERDSG